MKESTTYMAILEEGREEGREEAMKDILFRQGRKRFGPPTETVQSKIDAIHDVNQLQDLAERLLDSSSWEELLGE